MRTVEAARDFAVDFAGADAHTGVRHTDVLRAHTGQARGAAMIVVNDPDTKLCSGMKFQQREAFGSKRRDGRVTLHPRGKVHMAPPGAHTWQPLCGEPLADPAPRNLFGNNSVAHQDADWCSGCVAVLFRGLPADS